MTFPNGNFDSEFFLNESRRLLPLTKKLQLVAIGLVCSLVFGQFANVLSVVADESWNLFKSLDDFFYKLFYKPTALEPPKDLIIIDNEDGAIKRSRGEYAGLLRRLQSAGARGVAFDLYFAGANEYDSPGDRALVESVKQFHHVVLSADFSTTQRPEAVSEKIMENLALPDSICANVFLNTLIAEGVALPFDSLLAATHYLGHINYPESDFHHFPPVYQYNQYCFAALPLQLARLYQETRQRAFSWEDIPADKYAQVLVNFIPVEHFAPFPYSWRNAHDLLQRRPEAFQGKIVLVVNCSGEPNVPTPIGSYPRWAIIASLASQAISNDYIAASDAFMPALFSAFLAVLGLFWLLFGAARLGPQWQKTRFLFAGGNVLILLLVFLSLHYGREWFGAAVPLVAYNCSLAVVRARFYLWTRPPVYVDFGLTVAEGQNQSYAVQISESAFGEGEGAAAFPPFFEEKEFKKVLHQLARLQAGTNEMKWLGDRMFEALFQHEIFSALKSSLHEVAGPKKHLRLKLRLDAPALSRLPWEFMHSAKLPPGFLGLHKRLSIVRYLPLAQPVRSTQARIPLKILVAMASPAGLPQLDIAAEKKLLKKSLRPIIWGGDVRLRFCEHVTLEKLSEELAREPDILHFIGHGRFDPGRKTASLEFETESGEAGPVEAEALGNLLHETTIKLVVLNSCEGAVATETNAFTGMAQNLVRVGVPAVIAMQYPIADAAAVLFSKSFYSTLITNYSIDAAVADTRRYLMTKFGLSRQDWATPVLFMRASEGRIFN